MVMRKPVHDPGMAEVQKFPFNREFQVMTFRLIIDDPSFAVSVNQYLKPAYFENEVLVWAYAFVQRYLEQYRQVPSIGVILDEVKQLDIRLRPLYVAALEKVRNQPVSDEAWLRDQVHDFIRMNLFVRSFRDCRDQYNRGEISTSYETWLAGADNVRGVGQSTIDRTFLFDDFRARHAARMSFDPMSDVIPTGFPWLDGIMGGGLSKGELGCWVAYAKRGKSTLLVNHGVAAVRGSWSNVLHCVFEGKAGQAEGRYDAAFSRQLYTDVKLGNIEDNAYQDIIREYEYLKRKLVVRSFLSGWDYSVVDIHNELKTLQRDHNWSPDMIIVDYGDLLNGRDKFYKSDTARQKASFRDLKTLSNNGYAVWTASQAQRPDDKAEHTEHLLKSRKIADAYEKVRVVDFLGSINVTDQEFQQNKARLYAELYRDNAANQWASINAEFDRMTLTPSGEDPISGVIADTQPETAVNEFIQRGAF